MKFFIKSLCLILSILFILISCRSNNSEEICPPCEQIEGSFFIVKNLNSKLIKGEQNGNFEVITSNDSISSHKFKGILLNFDVDFVTEKTNNKGSFFSSAYAFSCACPTNGAGGSKYDTLINIDVITIFDFDLNHFSNDTINDIIEIGQLNGFQETLPLFLENSINRPLSNYNYFLSIEKSTEMIDSVQFKIDLELTTKSFSIFTDKIKFVNH